MVTMAANGITPTPTAKPKTSPPPVNLNKKAPVQAAPI